MVIGNLMIRLSRSVVTMLSIILAIAFLAYSFLAGDLSVNIVESMQNLLKFEPLSSPVIIDAATRVSDQKLIDKLTIDEMKKLAIYWGLSNITEEKQKIIRAKSRLNNEVQTDDPATIKRYEQFRTEAKNLQATIDMGEWLRGRLDKPSDDKVKQIIVLMTQKLETRRIELLPLRGTLSPLKNDELLHFTRLLEITEAKNSAQAEDITTLELAFEQNKRKRNASLLREMLRSSGVSIEAVEVGTDDSGWLITMAMLTCMIGIANAMLMSVTERFREIATMKCLGAQDMLIVKLFLLESGMVGIAGAIIGIPLGMLIVGLAALYQYGMFGITYFPWGSLLSVIGWSLLAGIVLAMLGTFYPAILAARMKPVDALRVEE